MVQYASDELRAQTDKIKRRGMILGLYVAMQRLCRNTDMLIGFGDEDTRLMTIQEHEQIVNKLNRTLRYVNSSRDGSAYYNELKVAYPKLFTD